MITRLEKTLLRLEAQTACFNWCFDEIAAHPGVVFELGLGLGRTWNHLNHYLPEREIYAFDRQIGSYRDCTPEEDRIILGEIAETLPQAARRFKSQVILAHTDIGSFDKQSNRALAAMMSQRLAPALAPQALVMSDLPLKIPGTTALELPDGAAQDRYYLYRNQPGH